MQFEVEGRTIRIVKEPGDPRISTESQLLYKLRNWLRSRGQDVIKKRMAKDGHMVDEEQQYVRSRRMRPGAYAIYDPQYAIRNSAEEFRTEGKVELVAVPLYEGETAIDLGYLLYGSGVLDWRPDLNLSDFEGEKG
jgi:hypothetical protein